MRDSTVSASLVSNLYEFVKILSMASSKLDRPILPHPSLLQNLVQLFSTILDQDSTEIETRRQACNCMTIALRRGLAEGDEPMGFWELLSPSLEHSDRSIRVAAG